MKHPVRKGSFFVAVAALLVTAVVTATAVAATSSRRRGTHPCVVAAGSGDQAFTRNFNPFNLGTQRDFTWGGIYENLLISTAVGGGRQYNVLGQSFAWSKDGKTLTITVRPNVKWSDGKPLTAEDVQYSLTIGRQDKAADRISLTPRTATSPASRASGANKVAIRFKQVDSTFLGSQLPTVPIVPKHVWSKVRNVVNFANPNPVGSGPFNRVTRFSGQSYQLSKNPNYWAKGLPRIDCVQRIFTASNDAGLLQIVSGQADWTHNFVPNVESAYMAKDPKNYHNAYLTTALPVSLTFNTTEYPYSLVAFRKGVSQAIDRNMVSKIGEYGYAPATTALGLEFLYPKWINPALRAKAKQLATYDPAAARKAFTDGGFTYRGSRLIDPKGNPVSFQMHVIGGWSDWVSSLQIISRNLQAVGIDASVKIEPDWPAWVSNSAISGTKPSLIWSNGAGTTRRRTRSSTRTSTRRRSWPPGRTRRRSGTSSATPSPGRCPCCGSSRARSTGRSSCRPRTSCRRSSSTSSPSSRCSSARAGRPTARSTSRAGSPGRTSTPTRSSRRSSRCRSRFCPSTTPTRRGSRACPPCRTCWPRRDTIVDDLDRGRTSCAPDL